MNILKKLTLKSLKLNKKRTIVTIIGIILSTALICAVAGMITSVQKTLINYAKSHSGNYHVCFKNIPNDELKYVKENAPEILTKTGIMVGLGESDEEIYKLMDDVLNVGCDIFTIGQYLQPSRKHVDVEEYVSLEKFEEYKEVGMKKGFRFIASSPLVRSSYKAAEALEARN